MSPRFFADVHVPLDAIKELQRKGVDIVRSIEAGFSEDADDLDLLAFAVTEKRIFVTCDQGFEHHGASWLETGNEHFGIVYFNMATRQCQDIGFVVREIEFLNLAAQDENDLRNQFWRAKRD